MAGSDSAVDWRPGASLDILRLRSSLLRRTRQFFAQRGVLEVETPLLAAAGATDPHLHSLTCTVAVGHEQRALYLQTSPELAMKRLLAAGSGSIYQICKAFRDQELGRSHNPEFTILEWYRVDWNHHRLMDEVDEYLVGLLDLGSSQRHSYRELFLEHLGLDPHRCPTVELQRLSEERGAVGLDQRDELLMFLLTHSVEPRLATDRATFVYDYPASQAALARVAEVEGDPVAQRFEVYVGPVELANGFYELCDPVDQRRRFAAELDERRRRGLPLTPIDERFLAALSSGLPACAGVALGFDRLVMLAAPASTLSEVLAFTIDRA